jgi:transcriptional regulator with XRE-family HTH domain
VPEFLSRGDLYESWQKLTFRLTHFRVKLCLKYRPMRTTMRPVRLSDGRGDEVRRENGEIIRAWRERRGMTQHDLASALGLRAQTVSGWERGEYDPRPSVVIQMDAELEAGGELVALYGLSEARVSMAGRFDTVDAKLDEVIAMLKALHASDDIRRLSASEREAAADAVLEAGEERRRRSRRSAPPDRPAPL